MYASHYAPEDNKAVVQLKLSCTAVCYFNEQMLQMFQHDTTAENKLDFSRSPESNLSLRLNVNLTHNR